MNAHLLELGVGGIFALLVIKEVLPHFRKNNGKLDEIRHDHLVELVKAVNENISAQTEILRDVCKQCFKTRTEIISEIKKKH